MDDKNESEKMMEELKRIGGEFNKFIELIGEALNELFYPKEDDWEMKCPYKEGDEHYCLQSSGDVFLDVWNGIEADNRYFSQGNIFPTEQAAVLEAKRRNLLTRFRAFRDECNGDWKANWNDVTHKKYYVFYSETKNDVCVTYIVFDKRFHTFGYFKNGDDAYKAIELFGDEIKALFVDCEA